MHTSAPGPVGVEVKGNPTPEVLAAIVAAIEVAWPRTVVIAEEPVMENFPWRFSGRWWSRPATARRQRPWLSPQG